jgi:hypothetical protein
MVQNGCITLKAIGTAETLPSTIGFEKVVPFYKKNAGCGLTINTVCRPRSHDLSSEECRLPDERQLSVSGGVPPWPGWGGAAEDCGD